MKRIGLISDTHGYWDEAVLKHFEQCDEVWHAGDFGNIEIAERLNRCLATLSGLTPIKSSSRLLPHRHCLTKIPPSHHSSQNLFQRCTC